MKKKIAVITIILCLMSTSAAFARGSNHRNYGGHHNGYHGGPHYSGYRGGGHHNNGLGIAFGIAGGLLLGSALMYSAAPPPRTIVYGAPYTNYSPDVIVRQPRLCVEERIVTGEWQVSKYYGRQVWVSFQNPVTARVQVPCY